MTNQMTAGVHDTAHALSRLPLGKIIGGVVAFIIVLLLGLGFYWSLQPPPFDVRAAALQRLDNDENRLREIKGTATVAAAITLAETLLDKPGGFTYNDVTPPGILMDNMPHWEYGLLTELRDSVRSLRNEFSRSQTQSVENAQLAQADAQFNFNPKSWMLPSAEEEYRRGIRALENYFTALASGRDPNARFFARADNLRAHLQVIEKRLGSYAQRLSASVGDSNLTAGLIGEGQSQMLERTPWHQIDDIFYEARGYAWALLHMMQALEIDFSDVLRGKNAEVSMQQIIRDLRGATQRKWAPVVLNGHGYGFLANHSLILASHLARVNAAVINLRELMERG